jgi:hypothetical protein
MSGEILEGFPFEPAIQLEALKISVLFTKSN